MIPLCAQDACSLCLPLLRVCSYLMKSSQRGARPRGRTHRPRSRGTGVQNRLRGCGQGHQGSVLWLLHGQHLSAGTPGQRTLAPPWPASVSSHLEATPVRWSRWPVPASPLHLHCQACVPRPLAPSLAVPSAHGGWSEGLEAGDLHRGRSHAHGVRADLAHQGTTSRPGLE